MNRDLTPCVAPDCDEAGMFQVDQEKDTGLVVTYFLCELHMRYLTAQLKSTGATFTAEGE